LQDWVLGLVAGYCVLELANWLPTGAENDTTDPSRLFNPSRVTTLPVTVSRNQFASPSTQFSNQYPAMNSRNWTLLERSSSKPEELKS
jgi:hypothetical protein